jgi:hypothetical protein
MSNLIRVLIRAILNNITIAISMLESGNSTLAIATLKNVEEVLTKELERNDS